MKPPHWRFLEQLRTPASDTQFDNAILSISFAANMLSRITSAACNPGIILPLLAVCREPVRAIASSAVRIPSSASPPSIPASARGYAETRKYEVRDPVTEFIDLVPFTFSDGTVEPLTPEEEEAAAAQNRQQQGAPDAANEKARIEKNLRQAMDIQDEESGRVTPDDDQQKGRAAGGSGRVDSKA